MNLKDAVVSSRLSYAVIAEKLEMSKTAISRLVNFGEFPTKRDPSQLISLFTGLLTKQGFSDIEFPQSGVRPGYGSTARRQQQLGIAVVRHIANNQEDFDLMKMDSNVLSHFGLRRNPFLNDVEEDADVFPVKAHVRIAADIKSAIDQRAMMAITGESGSGKTTIWDGIESELMLEDGYVICKPKRKNKEKITPDDLARCLIYGIAGENTKIHRDPEDRGSQLGRLLVGARRNQTVDTKVVLFLDDAHFVSSSVLRQLKTFYEEKVGRVRLMAIVLIGLPELRSKLARFSEIGNRCQHLEMPMVPVAEYLAFKLNRVNSGMNKIFDQGGRDAFLERFRDGKKVPMGYPLIINATCIRAMVKLERSGAGPGELISREIIDQLPGAGQVMSARRVA